MNQKKSSERREDNREVFTTEAELYLESTVFKANVRDFSKRGVRFDMSKPINFQVRFKIDGKRVNQRAQLVWSRKVEGKSASYGFNYLEQDDSATDNSKD